MRNQEKTIEAKILRSIIALSLLGAVSCTKETPQEEVAKHGTQNKSLISTEEYLFTASTREMTRTSPASRPFSYAETKRVKLQLTEENLLVLETEKDDRFKDNSTNDRLVIAIPITHVDYTCGQDAFGECTNKEVEDTKKPWNEKANFIPKVGQTKSGQLDLLPINFENALNDKKCFSETRSELKEINVEEDAINLTIKKDFQVNIECLSGDATLADSAVTAEFHYSLVKVNSVTSPDYQKIQYPSKDQNTFGFFNTERTPLDIGNEATESGKIVLMNRWNPNRSEIVYHLSDNFYKTENANILKLTRETVDSLNKGLKTSGVKFQIRLSDELGKSPNDIRNSMIVLVEDPVAAGLLGYGPQTEDPLTGEIISARSIMFLGSAVQSVKRTYGELLLHRAQLAQKANAAAQAEAEANKGSESGGEEPQTETPREPLVGSEFAASLNQTQNLSLQLRSEIQKVLGSTNLSQGNQSANFTSASQNQMARPLVQSRLREIEKSLKEYTGRSNRDYSFENAVARYKFLKEAKHCEFTAPNDGVLSELSNEMLAQLEKYTGPWELLTQAQRKEVIDIIVPAIWVPTLIHELGHNLGLRHNFQGSEDKSNFYTDEELKGLGITRKIPSTSMMEYVEDVRALPVLGKYDIAALRFGYGRKVETASGEVIEVPKTLKELGDGVALKDYGFCTDEHTGINAGCRRFDLGTNNVEIVQHLIKQYESFYAIRNLRRDRSNFSLNDDLSYARRIQSVFRDMRLMFEVHERIIKNFNVSYTAKEWESIEFLKDLRQASLLAGQFLMQVLVTPDQSCVVVRKEKPQEIAGVERLATFSARKDSCFDLKDELNEQFMVVGEYGKSIRSRKSEKSDNAYADQIDIRGVWADKLMALNTLFERDMNSFTLDSQGGENFADLPELRQPLLEMALGMATNQLTAPVVVNFIDGSQQALTVPVEISKSFRFPQMLRSSQAKALGIPEQESSIVDLMVNRIPRLMVNHPTKKDSQKEFASAFKVEMINPLGLPGVNVPPTYLQAAISEDELFLASPKNILARFLIQGRQELTKAENLENAEAQEQVLSIESLLRALPRN